MPSSTGAPQAIPSIRAKTGTSRGPETPTMANRCTPSPTGGCAIPFGTPHWGTWSSSNISCPMGLRYGPSMPIWPKDGSLRGKKWLVASKLERWGGVPITDSLPTCTLRFVGMTWQPMRGPALMGWLGQPKRCSSIGFTLRPSSPGIDLPNNFASAWAKLSPGLQIISLRTTLQAGNRCIGG